MGLYLTSTVTAITNHKLLNKKGCACFSEIHIGHRFNHHGVVVHPAARYVETYEKYGRCLGTPDPQGEFIGCP